jgi:hypothetical protein
MKWKQNMPKWGNTPALVESKTHLHLIYNPLVWMNPIAFRDILSGYVKHTANLKLWPGLLCLYRPQDHVNSWTSWVTCRKHCVVQPFADYSPWCEILHFEKRHAVCQVDPMVMDWDRPSRIDSILMVRRLFRQNTDMTSTSDTSRFSVVKKYRCDYAPTDISARSAASGSSIDANIDAGYR